MGCVYNFESHTSSRCIQTETDCNREHQGGNRQIVFSQLGLLMRLNIDTWMLTYVYLYLHVYKRNAQFASLVTMQRLSEALDHYTRQQTPNVETKIFSLYACVKYACIWLYRANSRLAPSQWETSLQSNVVSPWQGANLESALLCIDLINRRD